jgi:hypothetical protein
MSARYCIRCDQLADPSEFMVGLVDTREDDGSGPHFWIHSNCIALQRAAMIAAMPAAAQKMLREASAQKVPSLNQLRALSKLAGADKDNGDKR